MRKEARMGERKMGTRVERSVTEGKYARMRREDEACQDVSQRAALYAITGFAADVGRSYMSLNDVPQARE